MAPRLASVAAIVSGILMTELAGSAAVQVVGNRDGVTEIETRPVRRVTRILDDFAQRGITREIASKDDILATISARNAGSHRTGR
jgi:hypothetical protein